MEQSEITPPVITGKSQRTYISALRVHTGASVLRNLVWMMSGDGSDFDQTVLVETPGVGTGRVRCAMCLPPRSESTTRGQKLPLLLVMEGGGFILGQPEDGQKQCRKLANELNAIVISIEYAKAPRHPYPHALLQVVEVLRWAFSAEAEEKGIDADPSRVALMGNSAGGNLAATASLLLSFSQGSNTKFRTSLPSNFKLRAQVLLYPSIETGVPYADRFQRASPEVQAQSLPIWAAQLMEDAYLPPAVHRTQIFVQPLLVETGLLRDLQPPPALILTAGMDCLKAEADAYASKLRDAGITVTLFDYPHAKHGFSHYKKGKDFRPEDVQDCWSRIADGLRESFR